MILYVKMYIIIYYRWEDKRKVNYDDEEIEEVDEELDDGIEDMLDDVSEVQFADDDDEKKEEVIIEEEEENPDYSSIYPEELNDER